MSFPSPFYMNYFKRQIHKKIKPYYSKFMFWHFSYTFTRISVLPSLTLQALVAIQCSPLTMFRMFSWDQKFCSSSVWV